MFFFIAPVLFHRTDQKLTITSKLPLNGPLALNSAKVQGEDQKNEVFTFDQHSKPLFSAKIQFKVKTKKNKRKRFFENARDF